MGVLQDQIDSADDRAAQKQDQIDNMQVQIDAKQEEQNAYRDVMITIESEVNTYLLSQGDWVFEFDNYFTGTLNSIDDNLTDWELYTILNNDPTYTSPTEFSAIINNNDNRFDIGNTLYFKSSSPTLPIPYGVVFNNISVPYDSTSVTATITMNMTEGTIPATLDAIIDIVSIGSPTYLTDRYSEFNFYNDYIHHPLGSSGSYGTKETIAALTNAKNLLTADKNKIIVSKTVFSNRA